MAGFQNVVGALRRTEAELVAQLESVRSAIASLGGGSAPAGRRGRPLGSTNAGPRKKRKMSAKARAAISAAQKKRWAKQKGDAKK